MTICVWTRGLRQQASKSLAATHESCVVALVTWSSRGFSSAPLIPLFTSPHVVPTVCFEKSAAASFLFDAFLPSNVWNNFTIFLHLALKSLPLGNHRLFISCTNSFFRESRCLDYFIIWKKYLSSDLFVFATYLLSLLFKKEYLSLKSVPNCKKKMSV